MNFILRFCSNNCSFFARLAIGASFLSACADRFGAWGKAGAKGVAWGNFDKFLEYTSLLNPYLPSALVPALGWFVTIAEILLGVMLIAGVNIKLTAFLSGTLLLAFALAMTLASGVKGPLDYSVFTAAAGCFLLTAQGSYPWSMDAHRPASRVNK